MVDLDFRDAARGDTLLAFGRREPPVAAVDLQLVVVLGGPQVSVAAGYDARVPRPLTRSTQFGWVQGQGCAQLRISDWRHSLKQPMHCRVGWGGGASRMVGLRLPADRYRLAQRTSMLRWLAARSATARVVSFSRALAARSDRRRLDWDAAEPRSTAVVGPWLSLSSRSGSRRVPWQTAGSLGHGLHTLARPAVCLFIWRRLPWETGRPPFPGISPRPPIDPPVPPRPASTELDFTPPATQAGTLWLPLLRLDFARRSSGRRVPVLAVYFVTPSIQLLRLPGREPIPVRSVELTIDADSWAWGLTATLTESALPQVEPTVSGPVEVQLEINGRPWVFVVEKYRWQREFARGSVLIEGRSRAAYLDAPYAPPQHFVPAVPYTARQLAEQQLTRIDRVTGFALDWQTADWLIPVGAWSIDGLTPLGVITRIAEAAGAYVNAAPAALKLAVQPRYPAPPWEWGKRDPDLVLPLAAVHSLQLAWEEKPAFDAVFVAGERAGVVGRIKRAGTAGNQAAPMVVDPLITHADAARARGIAVLSDTGRQARIGLELPLLPAIGVVLPGQLLQVEDGTTRWRGLVRATRIAAEWQQAPTVRQSLEVERHF